MGLRLHPVAARQGWQWLRQGLVAFARRPLAFAGLFATFLMAVLLLAVLVPVVGGALGLGLMPMLGLGFMIATVSARRDGPVHALQLVQGLRHPDRARKRAQWLLCGAYLLGSVLVITLAEWVDGGTLVELQRQLAESPPGQPNAAVGQLLADPRFVNGMLVRLGLGALLSVPFWHASALVHWAGQGAGQALFSSSLAVWRARGAFVVYLAGWALAALALGAAVTLLVALTGAQALLGWMALPLGLAFTSAFYVSVWFSFADSFGVQERATGLTIEA
ncbi:MAG: hypothetical protein KBC73_06660 [Burkholderiaceae bacterium]|nr:hypothetical protein [Burkholderiaceae bacterium]